MAGQWVMPGGGVPPCLYSGRHVIQILCKRDENTFTASLKRKRTSECPLRSGSASTKPTPPQRNPDCRVGKPFRFHPPLEPPMHLNWHTVS